MTQQEQEERLMYVAVLVDAKRRAEVLNDTAASSFLKDHLQSKSMVVMIRVRDVQDE